MVISEIEENVSVNTIQFMQSIFNKNGRLLFSSPVYLSSRRRLDVSFVRNQSLQQ